MLSSSNRLVRLNRPHLPLLVFQNSQLRFLLLLLPSILLGLLQHPKISCQILNYQKTFSSALQQPLTKSREPLKTMEKGQRCGIGIVASLVAWLTIRLVNSLNFLQAKKWPYSLFRWYCWPSILSIQRRCSESRSTGRKCPFVLVILLHLSSLSFIYSPRLSISWARIFPFGTADSPVSQAGLAHYSDCKNLKEGVCNHELNLPCHPKVIDYHIKMGVTPVATLCEFHLFKCKIVSQCDSVSPLGYSFSSAGVLWCLHISEYSWWFCQVSGSWFWLPAGCTCLLLFSYAKTVFKAYNGRVKTWYAMYIWKPLFLIIEIGTRLMSRESTVVRLEVILSVS